MADVNKILFTAEFNSKNFDKQVRLFAKAIRTSINDALKNINVQGNVTSLKIPVTITTASVNKAIQQVAQTNIRSLSLPVHVTQASVNAAFKNITAPPITVAPTATGGVAPTAPATTGGTTQTQTAASQFTRNQLVPRLDDTSILAAKNQLAAFRDELRKQGLTQDEITKSTRKYETELGRLEGRLQRIKDLEATFAKTNPGQNFIMTDKQLLGLQTGRVRLDALVGSLNSTSAAAAKTSAATERVSNFMDSFGFKVGILGFGLGILGGTLQRSTQNMTQFYTASAKAVEPLQRLQGLLSQSERTPGQRENVFDQINRLADLPGANLDAVVKSFRSLAALKLGDDRILELIEGLTKATALSGTGAEGTARLIEQFRQFVQSGILTERDLRTISEQGGVQVTDALRRQLGTLSPGKLEEVGPQAVIDALIEGLRQLETPLTTSSDRLNRLENSFNRIRLNILKLIDPGLEQLLDLMRSLEGVIESLTESFDSLTEDQKRGIGNLIVSIPILTGALAALLTTLAAVGIGLATLKHSLDGLAIIKTALAPAIAILSKLGSVIQVLFTGTGVEKALVFSGTLSKIGSALARVLAIVTKFATALSVVGAVIAVIIAYVTDSGLTRGIIDGALGRLTTAVGKLYAQLERIGALPVIRDLFGIVGVAIEEVINLLGTLANFVTDVLASALGLVLDAITAIIDAMRILGDLASGQISFGEFASEFFTALTNPIVNLGKLLAASFIEGLAGLAENRITGSLFGGLPGLGNPVVAQGLREVANSLKDGIVADRALKLSAGLDKFSEEANVADKQLGGLTRTLRDLQNTLNSLSNQMIDAISKMRVQQIAFQRDLALSTFDRETQRQIEADPNAFNASQNAAARLAIAQGAQRQISQAELEALNLRTAQTLRNPLTISAGRAGGVTEAGSGVLQTFETAIRQLNELASSGSTDLQKYRKQLEVIQFTIKNIKNAINEPNSVLNLSILGASEENQKKFKEFIEEQLKFAGEYQQLIGEIDTEQQSVLNENIRKTEENIEKQRELARLLNSENAQQIERLNILTLQNRLADEETELARLREEDLAGQAEQEAKIRDTKLEIVRAEAKLASEGLIYANALETQRITNEAVLKSARERAEAERQTAARIREQAKAMNELFRNSISQAAELQRTLAERATTPLPFLTSNAETATVAVRETDQQVVNDISGEFSTLLNGANNQFVKPFEKLFRETIANIFKDTGEFEEGFGTLFDALVQRNKQVQDEITATKVSIATAANENTRQDLLKNLERLETQGGKYGQVLALLTKLEVERGKAIENNTRVLQTRLAEEQLNLQFLQESLELVRQQIDLEARQRAVQAGTGQIDLVETIRQIAQERKNADAAEMTALRQKYALLRNELDIRELNLLNQARLAGGTEAEVRAREEALRKLFAERRKALGEQEQLEATTTEGEQAQQRQIDKWSMLSKGLQEVNRAAREARTSMRALFDEIASGEFVLDSLHKWLMRDAGALDFFASVGMAAFTGFAQAFADAIVKVATEGGKFLEIIGQIFGDVLIKLGTLLIQEAIMIPIMAFINALAMGANIFQALGEMAASLPLAAIAGATGLALIAAGMAMGGGGASASKNTANKAGAATGSQGESFEPNRDPRLVYQKALMAQIEIDIKTDDGAIVETVIKHVNQNGRLARLIGNKKLQFGY